MDVHRLIDHTLLKADADEVAILRLCDEARHHQFIGVCVNSRWIDVVARELKGTYSLPVSVVGFPLGAMNPYAKAEETRVAVEGGALEIDTVLDIGGLKSARHGEVEQDLMMTVNAAGNVPVKVILETSLLTDDEIRTACQMAVNAGAKFVKTSTGFSTGGATEHHAQLMRAIVGPHIGVKASGGIRDLQTLQRMVAAGASRIGTSNGVAIMQELKGSTPSGAPVGY